MSELIIKKDSTLADFEEYLGITDLKDRTLIVPNNIKEGGSMGHSLQYCQFLLTWARAKENPVAYSFLIGDDTDKIESFAKKPHGLAAAYFSNKIISDRGKGEDIKHQILSAAAPRIKAMHNGNIDEIRYGPRLDFVFIEGAEHQFHGALYSRVPNAYELEDGETHKDCVRKTKECNDSLFNWLTKLGVAKDIQGKLLKQKDLSNENNQEDGTLGRVLCEAFENTCQHAFRHPDGAHLKKNMRCVSIVKNTTIGRDRIAKIDVSSQKARKPAKDYFEHLASKFTTNERKTIEMLEFSIFDSGSGFASSAKLKDNTSDDLKLVMQCFDRDISSKPHESAGKGLYRILSAVHHLGGFLRLRTSSAEAFFASTAEFDPSMEPEKFVHGGLSHIEGTLITIGIPLKF